MPVSGLASVDLGLELKTFAPKFLFMELPCEIPVMTLPNAILFPQVMLPLKIYEPRYRKMLAGALKTDRVFAVAMQRPSHSRECPSQMGGLGLIRAAVTLGSGVTHLVLQGIARIELLEAVKYRPYRVHRYRPVETLEGKGVVIDALASKVMELAAMRIKGVGVQPPALVHQLLKLAGGKGKTKVGGVPADQILEFLGQLENIDQLADLISCGLLPEPAQRQIILESINLEERLKHLIHFLTVEIAGNPPESD